MNKKVLTGILFACSSAIGTGTLGIFLRFLGTDEGGMGLSEETLAMVGPVFMFLCFLTIALITDPKSLILKKKWYYLTMIGGAGLILYPLYNYTYVQVFAHLPVAIASLFHFTNSIVLVFFMRLFFKEKISKEKIICCVLAVVGILFVLQVITFGMAAPEAEMPITALGIFWGVAVAVSLAGVYTIDYFHINQGIPVVTTQVYACLCSGIITFLVSNPAKVIANISETVAVHGAKVILVTIGYCLVLGWTYYAITACYKYIDASYGALTFVLEPSVAALLGFLIFKESLTILQVVGIVIAVSAIVYMQYAESKKANAEEASVTEPEACCECGCSCDATSDKEN